MPHSDHGVIWNTFPPDGTGSREEGSSASTEHTPIKNSFVASMANRPNNDIHFKSNW